MTLLDYDGLDNIKDSHRRNVTAVLLRTVVQMLKEEMIFPFGETSPTNSAGTGGFSGSATDTGPVVVSTQF